jgi:porin
LTLVVALLVADRAPASINPWVASTVYDPARWDSSGPYAATSWLHPPPHVPGEGWGLLGNAHTLFATGDWHEITSITGGWGGARDDLMRRGLALSVGYVGALSSNPVGDAGDGRTKWTNDLGAGVFADLERLAGWNRTYFTASYNYFTSSYSPFPEVGEESRLVHLAIGHELFENEAEIALGRLVAGEEFASLPLACTSVNEKICSNPIVAAQTVTFPTYPTATWGAQFKLRPGDDWTATIGSYLVFPGIGDPHGNGVAFAASKGSGALTVAEVAYAAGGDDAPPGQYRLGGYYDGEQVRDAETLAPVHGTGGAYLMAQQMLFSEPEDPFVGLSSWLALSWAPENRNPVTFMAAGGLLYQGIIPSRSWDGLAFVTAWRQWGTDARDGQRRRDEPVRNGELLLELNYRVSLASWLWITPDLQGIIQPEGRDDRADSLIVGLQVGVVL